MWSHRARPIKPFSAESVPQIAQTLDGQHDRCCARQFRVTGTMQLVHFGDWVLNTAEEAQGCLTPSAAIAWKRNRHSEPESARDAVLEMAQSHSRSLSEVLQRFIFRFSGSISRPLPFVDVLPRGTHHLAITKAKPRGHPLLLEEACKCSPKDPWRNQMAEMELVSNGFAIGYGKYLWSCS